MRPGRCPPIWPAVADGADCVDGVGQLWGNRTQVFGPVASTTTLWRLCEERIDADRLPRIRAARVHARARAWAAGAAPDHDGWLHLPQPLLDLANQAGSSSANGLRPPSSRGVPSATAIPMPSAPSPLAV